MIDSWPSWLSGVCCTLQSCNVPLLQCLRCLKIRLSPCSQLFTPNQQHHNRAQERCADRSLYAKSLCRSHARDPGDLKVRRNEPSSAPPNIEPRSHLATPSWVAIKEICIKTRRRYHQAEQEQIPREIRQHKMPIVLESLTQQNKTNPLYGSSKYHDPEPCLRLEDAIMPLTVDRREPVVQKVTGSEAEQDGDERAKVEDAGVLWAEAILRGEENREGVVDADRPGEGHKVEEAGDEDGPVQSLNRPLACFEEGVALVARVPLLDADEALEAGLA